MMQISAQIVKWISVIAAHTIVAIRSGRISECLDIGTSGFGAWCGRRVGSRTSAAITTSTAREDPAPGLREWVSRRWRR